MLARSGGSPIHRQVSYVILDTFAGGHWRSATWLASVTMPHTGSSLVSIFGHVAIGDGNIVLPQDRIEYMDGHTPNRQPDPGIRNSLASIRMFSFSSVSIRIMM